MRSGVHPGNRTDMKPRTARNKIIRSIFRFFIKLLPPNTVVCILRGRLRGKKWMLGAGQHSCWLGYFEKKKQIIFSRIIHKGAVVYDIGAHVGFYTLLASVLVGPKGRVFAFEPSPRNICYLKNHLRLNGCDNVTLVEAAVAEKEGIASFEESDNGYYDHLSIRGNLKVKTVSLDNLVLNGKISPPDFIKIDAEGAELLVLSGAKNILVNYSPTIFLAIHIFDFPNQCCTFLRSINYDLQSIDENESLNNTSELLAFKRK